ncbi:MAG TPA: MerR family transcriptional regulator, partial [Candidatus Faecivivens stercorigallinarum]|nr:MerR family transcriptional regulator [Candidatus Faecivivens stercorigallinarum]
LKFYCREGLVPNVKRDQNNFRLFDERDIAWIRGVQCLRRCGMSIREIKQYMEYCLQGQETIPERKEMLEQTRQQLTEKIKVLQDNLKYIESKQQYYDDVLAGRTRYTSNLINV